MNRDKTDLFLAGINDSEHALISQFGFQRGSLPIRYLGLPLLHRKLRKSDYSPLIDKITAKFTSWTVKCLSFSGRLQLISSVIYSLVNFWCSAFSLPKRCLKSIEQLCNRFLWSGDISKRTNAKVSWNSVCLPKSEGGLGLRNLLIWNKVLNLRLVWLLFTCSGSLWVGWNKAHRLKNDCFWSVSVKPTDSWIWKNLLSLKPLVMRLLGCKMGNGELLSYWFDSWSAIGPLINLTGENGPSLTGIPRNARVADACSRDGWILPSLRTRCTPLLMLRNHLISQQPPASASDEDLFTWGPADRRSGKFSSKSAWELIRPREAKKLWFKAVWFKGSVPKHAFTFWTTNLDRLPLKTRLASWGMNVNTACCLCNENEETREHLFLHCDFSSQLWSLVLQRLGHSRFMFCNWEALITWLLSNSINGISTALKRLASHACIYLLWKERNGRIHSDISHTPATIFTQVDITIRDILLARRHHKGFNGLLLQWFTHS